MGEVNVTTSLFIHVSSYSTPALLSLAKNSNARNSSTYPRTGLYSCVATS